MDNLTIKYKVLYADSITQAASFFVFAGVMFFFHDKWLMPSSKKWLSDEIINNGYIYIELEPLAVSAALSFACATVFILLTALSTRFYYRKKN